MQAVRTIGLYIAKSVFQIHGVDAAGNIIVRLGFGVGREYSSVLMRPIAAEPAGQ